MTGVIAVDASVLIAILNREDEARHFLRTLNGARTVIGWPTMFEVRIWCVRRLGTFREPWLDGWIADSANRTMSFNGELERLASEAYQRFGKGRHPAALNFGDCMAYAVAAHHDAPLLFKGSDFARTDLQTHPASVALP
jgi:ribonuclease VapC